MFDKRVAVGHGLAPGSYSSCFACRAPLSKADLSSEHYVEGIQCAYCLDAIPEKSRLRSIERQRQFEICAKNNDVHIGKTFVKKRKYSKASEVAPNRGGLSPTIISTAGEDGSEDGRKTSGADDELS